MFFKINLQPSIPIASAEIELIALEFHTRGQRFQISSDLFWPLQISFALFWYLLISTRLAPMLFSRSSLSQKCLSLSELFRMTLCNNKQDSKYSSSRASKQARWWQGQENVIKISRTQSSRLREVMLMGKRFCPWNRLFWTRSGQSKSISHRTPSFRSGDGFLSTNFAGQDSTSRK
jgi:hypothetical protein